MDEKKKLAFELIPDDCSFAAEEPYFDSQGAGNDCFINPIKEK